ncbi:hypothetical protein XENTR_v10008748 [Xenopus tropicalis]|nr:hypothetical protein XENTR_v10008748 [Xenopus tropicalis]
MLRPIFIKNFTRMHKRQQKVRKSLIHGEEAGGRSLNSAFLGFNVYTCLECQQTATASDFHDKTSLELCFICHL